jgi:hypothetical protein
LVEGAPRHLLLVAEVNLILSDLLGPEFPGGLAEELADFIDVVVVGSMVLGDRLWIFMSSTVRWM